MKLTTSRLRYLYWLVLVMIASFGFVAASHAGSDIDIDEDNIYASTAQFLDKRLDGFAYFKIQKISSERKKINSKSAGSAPVIAIPVNVDLIRSNKPVPTTVKEIADAVSRVNNTGDDALRKLYVALWESRAGKEFRNVPVFTYYFYNQDKKAWYFWGIGFSLTSD